MEVQDELRQKYQLLFPHLNARQQQLLAAADAERLGKGGVTLVARISGFSRPAIYQAVRDLHSEPLPADRVRRVGAGRKKLAAQDPALLRSLQELLEPGSSEEAGALLSWTCSTTRELARNLSEKGHTVSHEVVARLLRELGFRLPVRPGQGRGMPRPERERRFRTLLDETRRFTENGWPVLGVEIEPRDTPSLDQTVHDSCLPVWTTSAVQSWWQSMGAALFPKTSRGLLCLDAGGGLMRESGLWRAWFQRWVNQSGLDLTVYLLPPGTYRWNLSVSRMRQRVAVEWQEGELDCEVSVRLCDPTNAPPDWRAVLLRTLTNVPERTRSRSQDEWTWSHHPVKPV